MPEEWVSQDSDHRCRYATDCADIEYRWLLTMAQRESGIEMDMLGACEYPPEMEVLTGIVVATGVDKPTPVSSL